MLKGKTVVLGVTGGIAAYKSADLVSRLKKMQAQVHVIMTEHATAFVGPLTFQTLSQNPVAVGMFDAPPTWDVEHIALAKAADLFVIAPATANVLGKLAHGLADDMLTTTVLATKAPILLAPAMNTAMYQNPAVQENLSCLRRRGYHIENPGVGRLACGDLGPGKMAEPEILLQTILKILVPAGEKPTASADISPGPVAVDAPQGGVPEAGPCTASLSHLQGKRMLVTAGPTFEPIDPFRFITNPSSGKMGFALAACGAAAGAQVTLVAGPTHLETPAGVTRIDVRTAQEMYEAVMAVYETQDLIIKAAAVSDFRPADPADHKLKKAEAKLTVDLVPNPDILKTLGQNKGRRVLVGFAAETRDLAHYAKKKLEEKNLDMIVCNDISGSDIGFRSDNNQVTLYTKDGGAQAYPKMSKQSLAAIILEHTRPFF